MTDLPAYLAGLLATLAAALFTGWRFPTWRGQLWRVAIAIFLNWAAGVAYVQATGDYTPWMFWIAADAITAMAVMWHPAGRMQVYIGLFFALQIAGHIAFGGRQLVGLPADPIFYYDAVTYVAWAQLAAIGVWTGGIWVGSVVPRHRNRRAPVDRRARLGHHRK